ncbi:hypothetical protein Micbo1qcDRAFT_179387 [Microdochium bolleyi]|uniref:Uncharacterized protein n=1 Tax=Microdochium bolleyi TaxID=196109 RepID=A0A136IR12_9PEZI|nr:hypothetical protein Micbo1qcDRAFT_179387 [Microdochium bolleyi]
MERTNIPPVPADFACPPLVPTRKQLPVTLLRMHSAIDNMPMIEAPPDSQGWPDLGHDGGGGGGGGSGPYQNPIPSLDPSALSTMVPHPEDSYFTPLVENEMPGLPALELPAIAPDDPTQAWTRPPADGFPLSEVVAATALRFSPNPEYLEMARRQIMTGQDGLNFIDEHGYIIELADGQPTSRGEATYFTAVAATAIALGNYNADAWEAINANTVLAGLLGTLRNKSWGNMDNDGVEHPIRHPDWLEYDGAGTLLRRRPLNRDSFGQIVAAGYYAFHGPNSSEDVRSLAKGLIARWVEYLPLRGYRTHSNYIKDFDEFETDGDNFKHLFATAQGGTISALGKDTFQLLAHELVALRRCADSMDIDTSAILPLFESAWVALKELGGSAANLIAKQVGKGMAHVLDSFDGEVSASWEVIPGWSRSKIKVKAKLGIPRHLKAFILDYVDKAAREYIKFSLGSPEAAFLGQDEFVRNLVLAIVGFLPGSLQAIPLYDIFYDALVQVIPVADVNLFEDTTALTAAVLLAGATASDSSLAGFLFWNIAVAFDAQPALINYVKPPALAYLELIKNAGNPNGMWAWLCGDDDIVIDQLNTFEAHKDGWTQYAYASSGYNNWVTSKLVGAGGDEGHYSSRIDYLALHGFFEKGRPVPPRLRLKSLWEAVENLIAGLLAEAQAALDSTGEFVETLRDVSGALVLKTINVQGTIMYETFDALGQTAQFVANVDGTIRQTLWSLHDRVYYVHAVFARSVGDFIPVAESLIEFHLATDEAVCRVWQWADGNVLQHFTKWELRVAEGTLEFGKRLADQLRQADGRLVQRVYSLTGDVLLSFTVWGASTRLGKALWQDCLEIWVRDPAGVLSKWGYETGKILTGFSKWIRSSPEGVAEAVDMVQKVTRSPSAALDVVTFGIGGSLLDSRKWTTSSDVAGAVVAAAKDISLVLARDAASSALEEWIFDGGGVVRQYRKWATSLPNGAAEAVAQILEIVTLSGGAGFEINWFKDGVSVAAKVVDVLGKPIKDAIQGIANAIGGLFG